MDRHKGNDMNSALHITREKRSSWTLYIYIKRNIFIIIGNINGITAGKRECSSWQILTRRLQSIITQNPPHNSMKPYNQIQ